MGHLLFLCYICMMGPLPGYPDRKLKTDSDMTKIGTTFTKSGKKAVLCGSGELGKEVALELQRYGVEVVALDKYANAPAMHVAHSNHVLSMLDGEALEAVIKQENPDYIIPEIEAIATDRLVKLEEEGLLYLLVLPRN